MTKKMTRLRRWLVLLIGASIVFMSCDKPSTYEDNTFTISGLITDYLSAEPIHGVKVSLYIDPYPFEGNPSQWEHVSNFDKCCILYSTIVTYDDGFYSLLIVPRDTNSEDSYFIIAEKEGYEKKYSQRIMYDKKGVTADLQLKQKDPELIMTTLPLAMKYVSPQSDEKSLFFDGQCKYSDYDQEPFTYGFVFGPNRNPTIQDDCFISGTKYQSDGIYGTRFKYKAIVNGTIQGQTYYVRAYGRNDYEEAYGENVEFVAE